MTDAQITDSVRARLAELEQDGRLTPAAVVEDAKNPDSPLHDLFTWDVEDAAYKHWLQQARIIIKTVRLVAATTETITLNAPHYVRDPSANPKDQGYVSVMELRKDPVSARQSLRLEFSRVEGALTRARAVAGALGMEQDIEALIAHLIRVKDRVDDTVAA